MRVSHPASFFTALPLSTAGKVFSIHERAEEPGLQAGGRVGGGAEGCTNTSRVLGDARCVVCGDVTRF